MIVNSHSKKEDGRRRANIKKVVMLAMVLGLSVSGCGPYVATHHTVKGWTRNDTSIRQTQLDYQMCSGDVYIKEGISREELEKDFAFCSQASEDRERHKEVVSKSIGYGNIIPYVGVGAIIASAAVKLSGSLSVERCMKSKGYVKSELLTQESERECMEAKGYGWE